MTMDVCWLLEWNVERRYLAPTLPTLDMMRGAAVAMNTCRMTDGSKFEYDDGRFSNQLRATR
jgi:hypothetical protein